MAYIGSTDTAYHYDLQGHLIAEVDATTQAVKREYIWLGDQPVAVIAGATPTAMIAAGNAPAVYYIHSDQLNTPRLVTDTAGVKRWSWDVYTAEPFGATAANEAPAGQASAQQLSLALRFAGQYQDKETGAYYNQWRTYSPALGRYLQSDPIGLNGGLNIYAYVGGNPLSYSDPLGLLAQCRGGISTTGGRDIGPLHHDYQCWFENGKYTCRGYGFDPSFKPRFLDKVIGPVPGKVLVDGENTSDMKELSCTGDDNNKCMDKCAKDEWDKLTKSPPEYGLVRGETCQSVAQDVYSTCSKKCGKK